jgi:hypothetical protein
MSQQSKFFAVMFLLASSVGCTFLSMIYGWGIMPKRVWVIILVSVGLQGLVQLVLGAVNRDGKA